MSEKKQQKIGNIFNTMRLTSIALLMALSLTACREGEVTSSPCDGRQWKDSRERLDCLYPNPPLGRWHAVYTKEFAKKYNLPSENISSDFSEGVDYMEMEVLPYNKGMGTACMTSMLIKKPHNVALYYWGDQEHDWVQEFHKNRKLTHFIDLKKYKSKLKQIGTFEGSAGYYNDKNGGRISTFAFYAEDVLPEYDYITANLDCRTISFYPNLFPDGYNFFVNKASVWGKYESPYRSHNNSDRPKGEDFLKGHFYIDIPKELPETIFKNVPIGGR
jgi:hypothetical protein